MDSSTAEASARKSRVSQQRPWSAWVAVKGPKLSYRNMGVKGIGFRALTIIGIYICIYTCSTESG